MAYELRPDLAVSEGICPVCGGTDFFRFDADAYDIKGRTVRVVECSRCEIAWQWPMARDESAAIMQNCHSAGEGFWDPHEALVRTGLQVGFIAGLAPPGKLLDIGGADGQFASAAAQLGWDCTVIDPAFPAKRISDRVNIINGVPADLPAGSSYDVATMWAMIEHVNDYVSLMRDAFERLKPGGKLVIEALNYQSLQRVREGRSWWGFQVDHRWYLAPSTYEKNARDIGFRSFEIARTVLRTHWRGEQSQIRSGLSYVKQAIKEPQHAAGAVAAFVADRRSARKWPGWCSLPLQLVIATK